MTDLSRRSALALASVAGVVAALPAIAAEPDPFAAQVDQGLATLRRRADEQRPLCRALTEAIGSGDIARARAAYVASRPPYEEIEVLAASFPERDADIDARPYAVEGGETNPAFKGFHKVEALLFRDEDVAAALPVAQALERSVEALTLDLRAREAFSSKKTFEGLIALATEIGAKKISSEEETWSDRSLLIFRHNLIGIESQYRPFAAELSKRDPARQEAVLDTFRRARAAVDAVHGDEPGGRLYSDVVTAERRAISRSVYAHRDALARAAEALAIM